MTGLIPSLGRHSFSVWHCSLANDDRFKLIAHIPNDSDTLEMFESLYKFVNASKTWL